jgi:hypothetical protein
MNRRPRLPGADELFRSTGGGGQRAALAEAPAVDDVAHSTQQATPAAAAAAAAAAGRQPRVQPAPGHTSTVPGHSSSDENWEFDEPAPARPVRIARRGADARPTGRERHDEKITVYCSPEELLQIEQARLTLRGSHGVAVDRGRIVREAVAVVLADLEAKGDASILVRRLRGR